jgi:hypothetical protein
MRLKHEEIIDLFEKRCTDIADQEGQEKGPLSVREFSFRQGIVPFPFPIIRPFSAHFDYEDYPFTGKVTPNDLVGFETEIL